MGDRVGIDQIDAHVIENHDEAYRIWRSARFRDRVLVHVDAHHDMWWMPDSSAFSIANYICPALMDGIVRAVYWVIPDRSWEIWSGRDALRRHVRKIVSRYPGKPAAMHWEARRLETAVAGRPLVVCSADSLPTFDESVLLDIDTDYLVVRTVSHGEWDRHLPLPWTWPSGLLSNLRAHGLRTDCATIAYSVEGGYTPIQWKYLGAELAARLKTPQGPVVSSYETMRRGTELLFAGERVGAEAAFREAAPILGAPALFWLAHLLACDGRTDEGKVLYARALQNDPSYRSAFSSPGMPLLLAGRPRDAEREFARTLLLDPTDPFASLGLGWLAARRRQWKEAQSWAERSLRTNLNSIDATRLLAQSLQGQKQYREAIGVAERTLKLGLAGHRTVSGVIVTHVDGARVLDAAHAETHAVLARLCERVGDVERAIASYRIAVGTGFDSALVRFRLARLYAARSDWRRAWGHAIAGARSAPLLIGERLKHAARGVRRLRDWCVLRESFARTPSLP